MKGGTGASAPYSLVVKQVVDPATGGLIDGPETLVIPEAAGFTRIFELAWSGNGDRLAFRGEGPTLNKAVYIAQATASGSFLEVPSTEVSTSQSGTGPTWSPDDPDTVGIDETDQFLVYTEPPQHGPSRTLLVRQELAEGRRRF